MGRPVAKRKTTLACRRRRGVSCAQEWATMKLLMFMWLQQNCTKLYRLACAFFEASA